jgi:hypothetical protein
MELFRLKDEERRRAEWKREIDRLRGGGKR